MVKTGEDKVKKISEKSVYDGGIFKVSKVFLKNGEKEVVHSVIRFVKTICVLPVTKEKTIILERQYRSPLDGYLLEIPAGKIDEHESHESCMKRELEEETGYKAVAYKNVFEGFVSCGYSDEYMYYYAALVEKIPDNERKHFEDTDEEIELVEVTVEKALLMIRDREIIDAKTITMVTAFASGLIDWK